LIPKNFAEEVLSAALMSGGDFSELYVEDSVSHSISLLDGKVENAGCSHSRGAGVRVFSGVKSAYAYTNGTDRESLIATAKAAAAALHGTDKQEISVFVPKSYVQPMEIPFSEIDNAARIRLAKEAHLAAKSESAEITQVKAGYMDIAKQVLICNSEGVWAEDLRPRTRMYVEAVASNGSEVQTGTDNPGRGMGFEAYRSEIDPAAAGSRAAKTAVTMLHAPECPAGFLPVVIDGGFGGVIFHEACGHSLEATSVSKGNSEFCGKIGQKIAADCVSAVDDGTLPGEWGSIHVDDEGTPSQRNLLIENGILKGYMIDKLGARRMGMASTGSGRRQDYSYAPTSRMTNTFIAPGSDEEEEIIRSLGEGLYAKEMGGGSVNPLTGEFNFSVREGYWVKNGAVFCPVRGATLVGRGADVLLNIDRVAKRMWLGQGMCGSLSGSVPTNVGQPRIRVSGITIGGKGGKL